MLTENDYDVSRDPRHRTPPPIEGIAHIYMYISMYIQYSGEYFLHILYHTK